MATSLVVGGREDRESAKQRRKEEYKQDLELQIREKNAARQRERVQGMSVNASGYLDPEKSPERFKPLGGVHWTQQREKRTDRVRPYHTLFLYDKDQVPRAPASPSGPRARSPPIARLLRISRREPKARHEGTHIPARDPNHTVHVMDEAAPPVALDLPAQRRPLVADMPAGLHYHAPTYAGGGVAAHNPVDQAYNFFGVRDLGFGGDGGGGSSIVQPISMPAGDNRPIIVAGQNGGGVYPAPRFNPFEHKPDNSSNEYRNLLLLTQAEKDRTRRDNDEFQRRLRQELQDERRKLNDQENEARRRLEELRREAEERRREAERQRREAERLRNEANVKPKPEPVVPRPESKKTMVYYDMDDYRQRLIEERKKIEELLKAGKSVKEVWDVKVIEKPRVKLPTTPKTADRANRDNVNDFNSLKFSSVNTRNEFRTVYPDVPETNLRLEQQQEALLRRQESTLRGPASFRALSARVELPPRRAFSRPSWMDRALTPFPHVLRKRDRMYTVHSEGAMDTIHRRNKERVRVLGDSSSPGDDAALEELKLRHHRPSSTDTLADDTWLRPSSTAEM